MKFHKLKKKNLPYVKKQNKTTITNKEPNENEKKKKKKEK